MNLFSCFYRLEASSFRARVVVDVRFEEAFFVRFSVCLS